jgi:hypothetical protein
MNSLNVQEGEIGKYMNFYSLNSEYMIFSSKKR